MIDDPLTEGTERGSKIAEIGQGMYSFPVKDELELLMVTFLGENLVLQKVREIPVVGGSGIFRFSHGYALAKTVEFNFKNGNAVVEYDVCEMHF